MPRGYPPGSIVVLPGRAIPSTDRARR